MRIVISTHEGLLYDEEVDYVVVHNQDGEFAILKNCVPIISVIADGYIKMIRERLEYYVVVINGVLEYKDGLINVLTGEAHIGESAKEAFEHLKEIRDERLEANKKTNIDYTEKEKELRENIKKSGAGHL